MIQDIGKSGDSIERRSRKVAAARRLARASLGLSRRAASRANVSGTLRRSRSHIAIHVVSRKPRVCHRPKVKSQPDNILLTVNQADPRRWRTALETWKDQFAVEKIVFRKCNRSCARFWLAHFQLSEWSFDFWVAGCSEVRFKTSRSAASYFANCSLRNATFHVQEVDQCRITSSCLRGISVCAWTLATERCGARDTRQLPTIRHGIRRFRLQNQRGDPGAHPTPHGARTTPQQETLLCR